MNVIGPDANVSSSACVINSMICDEAIIADHARVSNSLICGSSVVCDNAVVHNSVVRGRSIIKKRGAVIGSTVNNGNISGFIVCSNVEGSVVTGKVGYCNLDNEKEYGIRENYDRENYDK